MYIPAPSSIPNPFHFMEAYHERVVPIFMQSVQIEESFDPDKTGSSEPCWDWRGPKRKQDHEPLPALYDDLVYVENEPCFDMAQVLSADELVPWDPGQLAHLVVPARLIGWLLRFPGRWQQPCELLKNRFMSTCIRLECVQPWHTLNRSEPEQLAERNMEIDRMAIIRRFKARKLAYEVSLGHATRHMSKLAHKAGPVLVVGSLEYVRREAWLSTYDRRLHTALKELEKKHSPWRSNPPRTLRPPDELDWRILDAAIAKHLHVVGECWVPRPDSAYVHHRQVRIELNGRVYLLKRLLFARHLGAEIPPGSMVKGTCGNSSCHRPDHHVLQN